MDEASVKAAVANGDPVAVWMGDPRNGIGDLGNARADARLLLAVLAAGGAGAKLLRDAGIDEGKARRIAGL